VRKQFNIGCTQKHVDDHNSVDIWVEELRGMGDANPVLLYKRQGQEPDAVLPGLSASDFVLCIQTITQRQFMLQFGAGSVVCLDSTHGTNQYDFNLVTAMVVDDFGQGNPVAFMISTKEDESVLTAFFKAIKERLPADVSFSASHIMTDDASQYHNAWVAVFGHAEKKLCVWHVDRAWRRAIKANVVGTETQAEVYHMLRSVLQELDEEAFGDCLSSLVDHLKQVAPRFAEYFETYCGRATEWAYCHRKGVVANTNMYLESFHNVLKSTYMERKANRRIDSLLHILLKIARDKAFERLIKVEKKTRSKKIHEINKRHIVLLEHLPPATDGGWLVQSGSTPDRKYFVVAAVDSCSCSVHCTLCNCCPHMYQCTCVDFAVHATVCKHVHTIHALRTSATDNGEQNLDESDVYIDVQQTSATDEEPGAVADCEQLNAVADEATGDIAGAEMDVQTASKSLDERTLIQGILSDFRQMTTMMTAGSFTMDNLLVCRKHVSAAKASLLVATHRKTDQFKVLKKQPSSKKLDKQFRFRSVRQKRRPLPSVMRKPDARKVASVRQFLLASRTQADGDATTMDTDMPLIGDYCEQIPYCVDTEEL
jgi:hypothetical protein